MKIKDFIEKYKIDSIKAMEEIQVKTHILFAEKYSLLERVKDGVIEFDENGFISFNPLTRDYMFDIAIIKFFTDLEFSDDSLNELDKMKCSGAFEEIMQCFKDEYYILCSYLDDMIALEVDTVNNTQNILNREIIKLSNKAIETLNVVGTSLDKKTLNKLINTARDIVGKFVKDSSENKPIPFNVMNTK